MKYIFFGISAFIFIKAILCITKTLDKKTRKLMHSMNHRGLMEAEKLVEAFYKKELQAQPENLQGEYIAALKSNLIICCFNDYKRSLDEDYLYKGLQLVDTYFNHFPEQKFNKEYSLISKNIAYIYYSFSCSKEPINNLTKADFYVTEAVNHKSNKLLRHELLYDKGIYLFDLYLNSKDNSYLEKSLDIYQTLLSDYARGQNYNVKYRIASIYIEKQCIEKNEQQLKKAKEFLAEYEKYHRKKLERLIHKKKINKAACICYSNLSLCYVELYKIYHQAQYLDTAEEFINATIDICEKTNINLYFLNQFVKRLDEIKELMKQSEM